MAFTAPHFGTLPHPVAPGQRNANPMPEPSAQHGSAEQTADASYGPLNGKRSYLNSMTPPRGFSPRPRSIPRRRERSPDDEDHDAEDSERQRDRRADREERRNSRPMPRNASHPPVGEDFRLRACEHSLREHQSELAAHRLFLQQLQEVVTQHTQDQTTIGTRLDSIFQLVDMRMKESDQADAEMRTKMTDIDSRTNVVTEVINNVSTNVFERIHLIENELLKLREEVKNQGSSQPSTGQEPSQPQPQAQQTGVPPPPNSWNTEPPSPRATNPVFTDGIGVQTPPPTQSQVPTFGIGPQEQPTHHNRSGQGPQSIPRHVSGSQTAYFHVGSPPAQANDRWSPLNPQNPNSGFGNWAPGAGTEGKPFEARDWSVEGKKVTKELRSFDGDMAAYDNWRRRIRDHFVSVNCNYALVFDMVERQKTQINWHQLASTRVPEMPYLNWQWVSTHLWSFTGAYLTDTQLTNRMTLVGGQEFNGLEHWRSLYLQNCGGSSEMANAERGFWIEFPKCERAGDLQPHLTQWTSLKSKYGGHLPEDHLIHMLHRILPDDVRDELKLHRDLKYSLQGQLDYLQGEMSTFVDAKLSKWNLTKLQQSLKPKVKNSTGISVVQAEPSSTPADHVPPPPVPDMAAFQSNLERMVAAAVTRETRGRQPHKSTPTGSRSGSTGSRNGRTTRNLPNPRFKGCWCCGSEDHQRQNCPVFAKVKKDNGGKVPKDYVGEYEKSMKTRTTSVKAINVEAVPPVQPDAEFTETYKLWPMLTTPIPSTPTRNRFSAFIDPNDHDDEDEDEHEMVNALAQISSKVNIGKTSQREKKSNQKPMLNIAYLNSIAQQVKSGIIRLPDIDLDDDASYSHVWALVDSGAGANVARRDQFESSEPVDAPPISLTVASGDMLPNKGARQVTFMNPDGTKRKRIFYEADVDMPILSVAEISNEGAGGSEVRFRRKDGFIEDLYTGKKLPFVKRKGVYFVKLYMPKDDRESKSSFTRQVR